MASVEEIRRLTLQAKSDGVQQVTAEVNQLADAQGNLARESQTAATVTDMQSRSLLSQEKALERLQARYDMAYRAQQNMTRDMDLLNKSRGQGLVSDERYAELQGLIATRYVDTAEGAKKAGDATKLASHEVSNIAAQVSDIGVSIAGGQSPFLVMAQQGAQISQVMGKRGVTEIISGLGQAIMSLATPTTYVLAGLAVGGYAISAAFEAFAGSTAKSTEQLKLHEEIIASIGKRYGEATDKVEAFSLAQLEVDRAIAEKNKENMQAQLDNSVDSLLANIAVQSTTPGTAELMAGVFSVNAFTDAIAKLQKEARDGQPDLLAFQGAVSAIINASDDPAVRRFGYELLASSEEAVKAAARLDQATGASDRLASSLGATAAMMRQFGEQMKAWDANQRVLQRLEEAGSVLGNPRQAAINNAVGQLNGSASEDDIKRAKELAAANYDKAQAIREAEEAARKAESTQRQLDRAYERSKQQVDDYVRDIELQTQAFGLSAAETERLRVRQELLTNAQRAGKEATAELYAEIEVYADRAAVAAQKYEDLQKRQDAFNDAANGFAQLGYDAFSGLIQGGKEFGDVVTDLTNKLLEMALQAALLGTGPLAGLFGTTGTNGAPGGILGSLVTGIMGAIPGNAAGNDNWRGGLSIVGEHGPELVNLPKGGQVSPTQDVFGAMKAMASMAAAGGNAQVNVQVVNNAGAKVDVQQSRGPNGEVNLKLQIERMVETAMVDQFQGRGRAARTLETNYPGLRRGTA